MAYAIRPTRTLWPVTALLAVLTGPIATAEPIWQVAAGPTRQEGAALEFSRTTRHWEMALGLVSAQEVKVRTVHETCYVRPIGEPDCRTSSTANLEDVDQYLYLSLQRRFPLPVPIRRPPVLGVGLAAQSATNAYVSAPVSFSLSLGLPLGERASVEFRHLSNAGLEKPNLGQDMILLRWRF